MEFPTQFEHCKPWVSSVISKCWSQVCEIQDKKAFIKQRRQWLGLVLPLEELDKVLQLYWIQFIN